MRYLLRPAGQADPEHPTDSTGSLYHLLELENTSPTSQLEDTQRPSSKETKTSSLHHVGCWRRESAHVLTQL